MILIRVENVQYVAGVYHGALLFQPDELPADRHSNAMERSEALDPLVLSTKIIDDATEYSFNIKSASGSHIF